MIQTTNILVCPTSTFPTFDSIYNQIKDKALSLQPRIPDIPALPTLPALPSMPSPLFPSLAMPDFEKYNLSFSVMMNQIFSWFKEIMGKLASFLGLANFAFPSIPIPYIDLKLPDIMLPTFDLAKIIADLKLKIPDLKLNISIPMLPDPLLPNMSMPEFEFVTKIQTIITNYCSALVTSLTSLLTSVVDKLNLKPFSLGLTLPTLPTIPTSFDAMMASIYASLNVPNLEGLLAKVPQIPSLSQLFMNIKLPGFELMNLSLPDPLFNVNFRNPQLEIMELCKNYYTALVTVVTKKIDDFVASFAGIIGFTPPLVCVPIPVIATA